MITMNLNEAKDVIMNEQDTRRVFRFVRAAAVLCAPENANQVSLSELLACMKRGNESKTMVTISEYAALALYFRTGRPRRPSSNPYEDFITDEQNWREYLTKHQLI